MKALSRADQLKRLERWLEERKHKDKFYICLPCLGLSESAEILQAAIDLLPTHMARYRDHSIDFVRKIESTAYAVNLDDAEKWVETMKKQIQEEGLV